jgi:hypothetical protein
MSRLPRRELIEEPEAGIYHCIQRAVRRAFLCGQDAVTGKNYDHRKTWIQQRLEFLAGQFGIDQGVRSDGRGYGQALTRRSASL